MSVALFTAGIVQHRLPFIAVINIIISLWVMRINLRFVELLSEVSPEDLQVLQANDSVLSQRARAQQLNYMYGQS